MTDLNDVSRAIGQLEGMLKGVGEKLDTLQREFSDEKRAASESRKVLYQRIEEQGADIAEHGREIKRLGEQIAQHKKMIDPAVADWTRIRSIGLGVAVVVGFVLSVWGVLSASWGWIKAGLRHLLES